MLGRLIVTLACAACLFAQTDGADAANSGNGQGTSFQTTAEEVIVPVTVTDQEGRFVSDLDQDDFRIFDQGVEQDITFFSRERNQPIVIGFLIDQSNQMRLHWKRFQDAAIELVLALMPPDDERFSGYVISYHTQAELLVNTTTDVNELLDAIREMKPGGGSTLFDAIYMAATSRQLVVGEPIEPRRILVVMGDGHDNASSRTLDQVVELAQRNLVTVYALSTVSFKRSPRHQAPPCSSTMSGKGPGPCGLYRRANKGLSPCRRYSMSSMSMAYVGRVLMAMQGSFMRWLYHFVSSDYM